jgi:oligopeptidase A
MNQLYNFPEFSSIDLDGAPRHLQALLKQSQDQLDELAEITNPNWDNLIYPIDVLSDKIQRFFSPISHLNSVMSDEQIRSAYGECLPMLSRYNTEFGQNRALYQRVSQLRDGAEFQALSSAQQKCVEDLLLSFRLGGVALEGSDRERYKEIAAQLSKLKTDFQNNLLDASNAWRLNLPNADRLQGLPDNSLALAEQTASQADEQGYTLTLEFPSFHAVMTFATDRELRREIYTAYMTRASTLGPHDAKYDNTRILEDIIRLRTEKAHLLGFDSYADYSVESKMVENPQQVVDFLEELNNAAHEPALAEMQQVREIAKQLDNIDDFKEWDVAFYSNKLKKQLFDFSEEDLKPYFPASVTVPGMFAVIGKLFGLSITQVADADVWHDDVTLYEIVDADGQQRGAFYLDNYARNNKRGGAWMDVCASRMAHPDHVQLPVAYLTCNLTPPVGDKPALLTHSEVTTLFHEFGHGLHHMLTQVDHLQISGISGVEWDAVELPSQFLENWCWERESLDMISGHFETGEKIPAELLSRARTARNFQSAMMTARQVEFALFDMLLHRSTDNPDATQIQALLTDIRSRVAVNPMPEFTRFQNGFSHIFAGGYAAGYFSYKWAEVLSCDAFSRFEEEGIFNRETADDFMHSILEMGGSEKAIVLFEKFRGRQPDMQALLRHSGLAA